MKYLYLIIITFLCYQNTFSQATYWWNDKVFYEIFVRSYYDNNGDGIGDFKGLLQKLDYLNDGNPETTTDLGITAIWLMPITESPSYHGYDVVDYKQIEKDYGTNQDFKTFLDSCHARGVKVIVDLVLNHTSSDHPWFLSSRADINSPHRNWYRWANPKPNQTGPWGQNVWHYYNSAYYFGVFFYGMPDLNYAEPAVKTEVQNIVKYWLDTIKVDGFRLDAIKHIMEEGSVMENAPSNYAFLREFRQMYKGVNPEAVAVGEVWNNTSVVLPYVDGRGMDFCFEFEVADKIISSINNGNPASIRSHMMNVINVSYPFLQYGTFLTNHDHVRVMSQLSNNTSRAKLAASMLLTFPGIPFIYYGEEIGMTSASDDPSKRSPLQWNTSKNAGFSTGSAWRAVNSNYVTNNIETMSADSSSLLNHYKKLINIRNNNAALRTGKFFTLGTTNQYVYAFARNIPNDKNIIIPLLNFSGGEVTNPTFTLNGFSGMLVGNYTLTNLTNNTPAGEMIINANGSINCTPNVVIPALGTAVLKATMKPTSVNEGNELNSFVLQQNYPNPFNPVTKINFEIPSSGNVKLVVHNVIGQEVKTLINQFMSSGQHSIDFNGEELNSGIYFYKLEYNGIDQTKKMTLMK